MYIRRGTTVPDYLRPLTKKAFANQATVPRFDNLRHVTVWLRIMRNRSATYSQDEVFDALADSTRRAVLELLRSGDRPAGEIAQAFPISRPAISRHLRQLRRAGLVAETRSGRHRLYRLNAEPLQTVATWVDAYRNYWTSNLARLKTYVEQTEANQQTRAPQGIAAPNRSKRRQRQGATR